jgi:CspA family cold shock protein
MLHGRVQWFNRKKGYGFIQRDDTLQDVFVHRNEIVGLGFGEGLREGEVVEFDVMLTPKGEAATNVVRRRTKHSGRFGGVFSSV